MADKDKATAPLSTGKESGLTNNPGKQPVESKPGNTEADRQEGNLNNGTLGGNFEEKKEESA